MPVQSHTICIVDGCEKPANGRKYCSKHLKGPKPKASIPNEHKALLRSICCGAACTYGERHEYGEQYCKKCKQPCLWVMP